MDDATARGLLESMVAWDQAPALTADQVTSLVAIARRVDAFGVTPDEADWEGVYDLNSAAAEGWRWKAAAVTGAFDFVTDGQRFDRSQVVDMCLAMSDRYRKRILGTIRVGTGLPIIPAPIFLIADEAFLP